MPHKPPPPALAPYLRLPPETSLILLTSTLGCSVNWLVARVIGSALEQEQEDSPFSRQSSAGGEGEHYKIGTEDGGDGEKEEEEEEEERLAVVLVSWIRDEKFWREEVRRGLQHSSFDISGEDKRPNKHNKRLQSCRPPNPFTGNLFQDHDRNIQTLITKPKTKILLILDTPTLLLPLSPPSQQHPITPQHLSALLLTLRSHPQIHTTYLSLPADLPLTSPAATSTSSPATPLPTSPSPLETDSAIFTITQAHLSHTIFSVRELATGAARDISGVLRVTRGGDYCFSFAEEDQTEEDEGGDDDDDDDDDDEYGKRCGGKQEAGGGGDVQEAELLYLVQRDGGVKVFQRGE
ncbi:hypothetical protein CERZMDRAFT_107799 [Cercospora zeae-maydis SCOH1-5]|uniref:Elongator complex protein 5 n=1 Tax=Cercospora zeae-maydis SCOH1-5 TaxID=717836 RepID=A0A6A6F219_9PEZI|nr:hypothetical protein CERZMDRAFT_107799 [Cercospora zeae-maydis SCOH1-5]